MLLRITVAVAEWSETYSGVFFVEYSKVYNHIPYATQILSTP